MISQEQFSADEAWYRMIQKIIFHGEQSAPRGLRIKEILGHQTKVDMTKPIVTIRPMIGYRFMAAEAWWILTGRNDVGSIRQYSPHISAFSNDGRYFDGAYGPKIVDQIRYVVDCLEKDADSRQALIDIWRPNPRDSRDIPCTISLQWMIRRCGDQEVLHCFDTMRSSDAWLGWPYDVFNFSMLSAYILLLLKERSGRFEDTRLGTLVLTAGSQHLYIDPEADGNKNIPYRLDLVADALKREPKEYSPLDIREFSRPEYVIDVLEQRKDRNSDDAWPWMKEFV